MKPSRTLAAAVLAFIVALLLIPFSAAFAGEITLKVWPTPAESQLDTDADAVPFDRAMRYWTEVGTRVKARSAEEYASLRFVGLGQCTRMPGPLQFRLEASRQETAAEVERRRVTVLRQALDAARLNGLHARDVQDLLLQLDRIN